MLCSLHIENIAIMDNVDIQFEPGFCVLTGETGAGKSILIDSINLLTGERSSKDFVRTGCDKALVEGAIFTSDASIFKILDEAGIEYSKEDPLILSREISKDGRSVVRINGRISTTAILKSLCSGLINIHGQHDNQSILNAAFHGTFLDAFAGVSQLLSEYRALYKSVQETEAELEKRKEAHDLNLQKKDFLSYQVQEITDAQLLPDEEDVLYEQRQRFLNSETILTSANECYTALCGDENASGALDLMESALAALSNLTRYDSRAAETYEKLQNMKYDLDDAISHIRDLKDASELEEIDINAIESRLDQISRLKRKYGDTIPQILEKCAKMQQELFGIENADYLEAQLTKELTEKKKLLQEKADALSQQRAKYASKLETAVMKELNDLDMQNTKFAVSLTPCAFTPTGQEKIEFLIAPNKGEALKPLVKIASGGELSRVILALKAVLAEADPVSTMIFDEVDTGVSGRAAQKIAEKLKKLAATKQIFVITHLAQVAAFATAHYRIAKEEKNGKTVSNVTMLDHDGRILELARIMSGVQITDRSMEAAKELLQIGEQA